MDQSGDQGWETSGCISWKEGRREDGLGQKWGWFYTFKSVQMLICIPCKIWLDDRQFNDANRVRCFFGLIVGLTQAGVGMIKGVKLTQIGVGMIEGVGLTQIGVGMIEGVGLTEAGFGTIKGVGLTQAGEGKNRGENDCRYFVNRPGLSGNNYLRWLCKGRTTTNRRKHCLGPRHQVLVHAEEECRDAELSRRAARDALYREPMVAADPVHLEPVIQEDQGPAGDNIQEEEIDKIQNEDVLQFLFEEPESDDEEGELNWINMIGIAIGQINAEPEETRLEALNPLSRCEEAIIKNLKPDNSAWYPFPNQEDLMNPLVVPHLDFLPEEAHGRNIYKLSQSAKWLKHFNPDLRVQMVESNKRHFYLFEPIQLKNLEIIIPVFFHTENGAVFARCFKPTLKSNLNHTQIKICAAANPTEISYDNAALQTICVDNLSLVYDKITLKNGLKLFDCCGKKIITEDGSETSFPNEWRKKAGGKVLRNVPITLYSDNTSGNKSKKWNKHISYYFTLSGLPPKISNQQFNCHFLCTTNITGPLELGEMVVEQLNDMATNGFSAYDSTIGKEVHVMTSMLCFLGDSPMHTKITNTHVPGNSLNSCRCCVLNSAQLQDRKKMPYVAKFLQKNLHGANCPNNLRTMEKTVENSKKLWECAKEPSMNLDKYNFKSAELAEKIAILQEEEELPRHMDQAVPQVLVDMEKNEPDKMFNQFLRLKGFDMVRDTPVEALHVILLGAVKYLFRDFMKTLDEDQKEELLALWYSFNTNSLNIPSIQPTSMVQYSTSLIGKYFRIVLQATPFLFFWFMTPSRVKIWSALCHMSAFIFQTPIEDMDSYVSDLQMHIDIFLEHIIENSAQWNPSSGLVRQVSLPQKNLKFLMVFFEMLPSTQTAKVLVKI
ncbi:hypothetical protein PTTG_29003 [Puccinia triticina 1-1 BBBD Race 1]|uniref:Uncharacterized protein n=1 Tax=Puccinia triticina (isolate 1-1 / race 1 (BBBD)) TaxID=630390 RepID=A0A180G7G4_PUCT1|nr:hypothetical protein PTTG_29003 [Puccinia triticina 1-1 BBBD Race 1]